MHPYHVVWDLSPCLSHRYLVEWDSHDVTTIIDHLWILHSKWDSYKSQGEIMGLVYHIYDTNITTMCIYIYAIYMSGQIIIIH